MRISRLTAIAVTITLSLLYVSPAHAARKPTVKRSQLPTVAEVATAFPVLTGGRRYLELAERETPSGVGECGNWRVVLKAPLGRWASYTDANNDMPYFAGYDDPGVFTYKYASTRKARKALTRLTSWLGRCAGTHTAEDMTWNVNPVAPTARVGTQAVAMTELQIRPNILTGQTISGFTHVAARSGRYLTIAIVQAQSRIPDPALATQLAQISISALGPAEVPVTAVALAGPAGSRPS